VLLDRNLPGLGSDAVIVDGLQAGRDAIAHLIELGHERIAVVTDVPTDDALHDPSAAIESVRNRGTAAMRLVGYVAAMRHAGLPVDASLVRRAPPTAAGAREATGALLDSTGRPTAVFATDNVMTLGAFMAFQDRGVIIPTECSLFGFDDPEWARIVRPPLTVVEQPVYDLGAAAARLLISRINGDDRPAQTLVLPARLVIRESTGRAPAHISSSPGLPASPGESLPEG
jgi:LacI family transcriptional regulator